MPKQKKVTPLTRRARATTNAGARCQACQGSGVGADNCECTNCYGRGHIGTAQTMLIAPSAARSVEQTDPTSILFRGKAYDITVRPDGELMRYSFKSAKSGTYYLAQHPTKRVEGQRVYVVMQEGTKGALGAYRLTTDGQFQPLV